MNRITTDDPKDNLSTLLNYAYAKDRRVVLAYADGENSDLCGYISRCAPSLGCRVTAEEVLEGSCENCDCPLSVLYLVATQAAELRGRLKKIEDILGDTYDLDALRQLMDAKRKGQIYFIPCKPGDTVYTLKKNWAGDITGKIEAGIVARQEWETSWLIFYKDASGKDPCMLHGLDLEEYQKTWFLSQKEAEAALLEGNEGRA